MCLPLEQASWVRSPDKSYQMSTMVVYIKATFLGPQAFENIALGEIAHTEQFLLLSQCFQLYTIVIPLFINIF